ncbi:MAG: MFS transporter [Parvibaculum sp.]
MSPDPVEFPLHEFPSMSSHLSPETDTSANLSRSHLLLLALASALVTANAYYIHPIIALVAADYGVSAAEIGYVPALNQAALALGIFLLLPLGDRFSNRTLSVVFACGQTLGLAVMAFAPAFWMFTAGSTLLGFFTITPYLLPAYVSKRVEPGQLGYATAMLTTGVIAGILVARAGSGIVAEYLGWRVVYLIATSLMLCITLALPFIMERPRGGDKRATHPYPALLVSTLALLKQYPSVILSGSVQGLSFGVFLAVWLGLGLHLTSPEMGYGVDVVGYLAAFSLLNLVTTARLGAWADRMGPRRARLYLSMVQVTGVALLYVFGHSLFLLMIPIVMMNMVGPVIDVTGRMIFLKRTPEIRTRMMTLYIVMMFIGGAFSSWAGTTAYEHAGWSGSVGLAFFFAVLVFCLSAFDVRRPEADG